MRGEVECEEKTEIPQDDDEAVPAEKHDAGAKTTFATAIAVRTVKNGAMKGLGGVGGISEEQYAAVCWEQAQSGEQKEAANAEPRNRKVVQPAVKLDTRNAAVRCRELRATGN